MQEKLKSWIRNDQVFYGLLLILVGCGSFALGRLSLSPGPTNIASGVSFGSAGYLSSDSAVMPVTSQSADKQVISQESTGSTNLVVASKSGTKYHLSSCAGAKQIKPENLVTFGSRAEAEQAGYTPAANCPGLQ